MPPGHDHSRWVFRTRQSDPQRGEPVYFKIWNSTYIRRDHMLRALEAGFYDETLVPALHGMIFHHGICRGYSMRAGAPIHCMDQNFDQAVREKTVATDYFSL